MRRGAEGAGSSRRACRGSACGWPWFERRERREYGEGKVGGCRLYTERSDERENCRCRTRPDGAEASPGNNRCSAAKMTGKNSGYKKNALMLSHQGVRNSGSPSWARTNDPRINSPLLYRLSYRGITADPELYRCFCRKSREWRKTEQCADPAAGGCRTVPQGPFLEIGNKCLRADEIGEIKNRHKKNALMLSHQGVRNSGSPSWARTNDPRINSPLLYRLSYRGITAEPELYRCFFRFASFSK